MATRCAAAAASERGRDRLDPEGRRAQILEAAFAYMIEENGGEVSPSVLATRLGISRNLVYHYFPNQGALVGAMIDAVFGDITSHIEAVDGSSGPAGVAALVASYAGFVTRRPALARLLVLSPRTSCLFRTKIYEKQRVVVDQLLAAYGGELAGLSPERQEVLRGAANAAVEFVRLFVVREAGAGRLDRSTIESYCTSVCLHVLQNAARLAPASEKGAPGFAKLKKPGD